MTAFSASFAATLLAAYLSMLGLRRMRVLDLPNARSSHVTPTVRGGGVAIMFGAASGWALAPGDPQAAVLALACVLGAVGLVDDLRSGISVSVRLVIQILAAAAASYWLLAAVNLSWMLLVFAIVGMTFWVVAYVNAFNFMDGINGISVVQTIVAAGAWEFSLVACGLGANALPAVIAAGALAFLPFNVPSARMFLGDVGSYFLGGWLSATALVVLVDGVPAVVVAAPLSVYITDTGTALIRRVGARERWREPHRSHVYQRLVDAGMSHIATALLVGGFCVVASSWSLLALRSGVLSHLAAWIGLVCTVTLYACLPRISRISRRVCAEPQRQPYV